MSVRRSSWGRSGCCRKPRVSAGPWSLSSPRPSPWSCSCRGVADCGNSARRPRTATGRSRSPRCCRTRLCATPTSGPGLPRVVCNEEMLQLCVRWWLVDIVVFLETIVICNCMYIGLGKKIIMEVKTIYESNLVKIYRNMVIDILNLEIRVDLWGNPGFILTFREPQKPVKIFLCRHTFWTRFFFFLIQKSQESTLRAFLCLFDVQLQTFINFEGIDIFWFKKKMEWKLFHSSSNFLFETLSISFLD